MYIYMYRDIHIHTIYIYIYVYIYIQILNRYPPTSPERRACETPPPSLEQPAPFRSHPSKQGPAVKPAKVARQLKSRDPALRAPRQQESRIWVQGC